MSTRWRSSSPHAHWWIKTRPKRILGHLDTTFFSNVYCHKCCWKNSHLNLGYVFVIQGFLFVVVVLVWLLLCRFGSLCHPKFSWAAVSLRLSKHLPSPDTMSFNINVDELENSHGATNVRKKAAKVVGENPPKQQGYIMFGFFFFVFFFFQILLRIIVYWCYCWWEIYLKWNKSSYLISAKWTLKRKRKRRKVGLHFAYQNYSV